LFHLLTNISKPDAVLHRFGCGNLLSLKQDGIRQILLDFHKKWYSANIMKLTVVGKASIAEQEAWVTEKFGPIENKDVELPDYAKLGGHPWSPEMLGRL
jgi:insulysin